MDGQREQHPHGALGDTVSPVMGVAMSYAVKGTSEGMRRSGAWELCGRSQRAQLKKGRAKATRRRARQQTQAELREDAGQ